MNTDGQQASGYADLAPGLLVEARGPVRVVTMNNPEALNAIAADLHAALWQVWDRLADDEEAGAVVLTGAGTAFSAGGDLDLLLELHRDPVARAREVRIAERLVRCMIECELPVVSAVNGRATGLGATVALLCDLVVMAEDAFIADPHVTVGLVAGDGGAVVWPLLMSLARAKEYLLLGDVLTARECERLGMTNRVVEPDQLLPTALGLAERLAAQPRRALRDTKRAINMHLRQAADLVLSFSLLAERETFAGPDVRTIVERFQQQQR